MTGRFDTDRIKADVSIAGVIGSYIKLEKRGRDYWACCPFHKEKTPSFHVDEDKGYYYCFGCHEKGDVIDFVAEFTGCSFQQACEALGAEKLPDGKPMRKRPAKQRVDPYAGYQAQATDRKIKAGEPVDLINPKRDGKVWRGATPTMAHPYYTENGDIYGYVLRLEIDGQKLTPMVRMTDKGWAIYPFEEPRPLYGALSVKRLPQSRQVILVEGEKAADAARKALDNWPVVTWAGGTNGVERADWSPLAGRQVVMIPDRDDPGLKAMRRIAEIIEAESIKFVLPPADLPKGWDVADRHWEDKADLLGWCRAHIVEELPETYEAEEPVEEEPLPSAPPEKGDEWKADLIYKADGDGLKSNSVNNAMLLLTYSKGMEGVLRWNDFASKIFVMRRPPWEQEDGKTYPREIGDVDEVRAAAYLEHLGLNMSPRAMHDVMLSAARRAPYNPVTDYLNSLEWDGIERLDHWLSDHLDVDSTTYSRMVGRRFLIGAVARALKPGCKMDNMLILEGRQGLKKSMVIQRLFSAEWFSDQIDDLGSKDSAMQIQGIWCLEMAELSTLSRADTNRIKEWVTRTHDRFRPPFGRNIVNLARHCVLTGTVNPQGGYLRDPTGGRRFWPVRCGDRIDIEGVDRSRNQIWAEAVQAYHAGERWWFEGDELIVAEEEQEDRYESDPWDEIVAKHIEYKTSTSIREVMVEAIGLPAFQQTKAMQIRIAGVLTSLGWERKQRRQPGGGPRKWVYVPGEKAIKAKED